MSKRKFRTGDTILHRPSGEHWVVAWADDYGVICQGWPESSTDPSHCELINSCTDELHVSELWKIAASGHGDRGAYSRRVALCREELYRLGLVERRMEKCASCGGSGKQQVEPDWCELASIYRGIG